MRQPLSDRATFVLDRMEPRRGYEAMELRAFLPGTSMDGLTEIMNELWVNRRVERFGYTGWRRQESTCASEMKADPRSCATCRIARDCAHYVPATRPTPVKPEELFDHAAFEGLFK